MAIKDNSDKVLSEVDRLIRRKLQKAALLVERSAKQFCPVLTGTLRRSVISNWYGARGSRKIAWPEEEKIVHGKKVHVKAGKTEIGAQIEKKAIVGSNVEYAPYVEMGTSKKAAKPFLRRALETNMNQIKVIFGAK